MKRYLSNYECQQAASALARSLLCEEDVPPPPWYIYGVPRGGVPVAYLMLSAIGTTAAGRVSVGVTDDVQSANIIVDDIIDSGTTRNQYTQYMLRDTGKALPFFALTDYLESPKEKGEWIVFPWESGRTGTDESATDIITRLLQYIGEDVSREGLRETPQRVLKAWKEWTSGYGVNPESVLKTFEDGSKGYDEMIVVRDLPFYSMCEHHMAPFFGTASIAYVPKKRIVGLSKLGRLLEVYARRLQVQERLTTQVADALHDALDPLGVAVLLKARHLCMESRGLSRQGHDTVTSAVRGVFRQEGNKAREEFLSFVK